MCIGVTGWDWKKGARNLLPKQEARRLWIPIFTLGEDLLCPSLGCSTTKTIYGVSYYSIDIPNGSYQVYLWEACSNRENSPTENVANKIRHPVSHTKRHKRECASRLSRMSSDIRLSLYTIWLSWFRYYGNKGLRDPRSPGRTQTRITMEIGIR